MCCTLAIREAPWTPAGEPASSPRWTFERNMPTFFQRQRQRQR